ncbi:MAG: hypothetical protein ACK41D_11960 [Rubricoccaceae bacterium]
MGKFLLLVVGSVAAVSLMLSHAQQERKIGSTARQALTEHEHLAREAALSGLNVALGTLARDYRFRKVQAGIQLDDAGIAGSYDLDVADAPGGAVRVRTVGRSGPRAAVRLEAEVIRLSPFPGALVVNANEFRATLEGSRFEVRGADVRPPSISVSPLLAGSGTTRPAVVAARTSAAATFRSALSHSQRSRVSGLSPEADVQTRSLPALIDQVFHEGRDAATATERYSGSTTTFNNQTIGSPSAPAVIHVRGSARLTGNAVGYGLLIVEGDLTVEQRARWEGVVIVASDAHRRRRVILQDDAAIYGSLVLHGVEELAKGTYPGFPGGHMDVDVFRNGSRTYHQHEYDKKYGLTTLDLIAGPGISTHWNAFRTAYAGRTLRVELFNAFNGSGTYHFRAGSSVYTGLVRGGFSALVPIDSLVTAQLGFTNLKELRGTKPSPVRSDNPGRDRALTVRFYDGPSVVYEVSAYEHENGRPRDGIGVTAPPSAPIPDDETGEYGNFQFQMSGRAQVRYAEEAIGRLVPRIEALRPVVRLSTQLQAMRVL